MQRLRITFAKTAAMKYTGHLDLHKTWERVMRRARLPLAYSQGFHPQPRMQLAAALPLGFTSECEVADFWMESPQDPAEAQAALTAAAPPGIQIVRVTEAPLQSPALQTLVRSAEYLVHLGRAETPEEMDGRIAALLAAPALRRERRGKPYDLRPLIEALERVSLSGREDVLRMRLAAREGATGRPEEVVEALGWPAAEAAYHRQALILADGERGNSGQSHLN
jgi:radical SAM-linked protein